ncbi:hypothetical protein [Sodaliphilus pleomorphus]|uniref:hypothetical protein n=1 Tax=Sodaliphilus pleomorphus TaxID=2606626 RepID=UPI0024092298|nr:hypothetical protein [Sodaliphilus pleomorphus]MDD6686890.1 hypothetical protein [Sodaliphilus pleomorphus]
MPSKEKDKSVKLYYIINPEFSALTSFVHTLPAGGYRVEHTYCNHRNVVELIAAPDGRQYVLKRFKRPSLVNQLVYGVIRKDKARRAYDNAFMLLDNGIDTPRPVACFGCRRHLLYDTGWYLSQYMPRPTIVQVYRNLPDDAREGLMTQFFQFTLALYRKHIIDKDYNGGNILVEQVGREFHFALVDINRMRRGTPSLRDEMRAMSQMSPTAELIDRWLPLYARLRGADAALLRRLLVAAGRNIVRKQAFKRRLRDLLGKKH